MTKMDDLTELILRDIEEKLTRRVKHARRELERFKLSGSAKRTLYARKLTNGERDSRERVLIKASEHLAPVGFIPLPMLAAYPMLLKEARVQAPVDYAIKASIVAQDVVCRWCREQPASTVDHVIPKSRGGSNRISNLVGSCTECNNIKADFLPKELGWKLHLPLRAYGDTPGN